MNGKTQPFDLGRAGSPLYEPSPEVREEFEYAKQLKSRMGQQIANQSSDTPHLSGGVAEGDWTDAVGEEAVGGGNPTPDQDVVEEIGQAVGLTYEDNEPLDGERKLHERDVERWELNPASADEYENEYERGGREYA